MSNFLDAKYLVWHILIALVLAVIVGLLVSADATFLGAKWVEIFQFFGGLFINALKMIVIPLILSAIIVGVASMAGQKSFGRIGGKTIGFYLVTGLIAIMTGLILVNIIAPGNVDPETAAELVQSVEGSDDAAGIVAKTEGRDMGDLPEVISRAIPPNIFAALTDNGSLLAIIFVAVVFGFFMTRLTGEVRETMDRAWNGVYEIMVMVTMWIIRFAPIGVFGLVTNVIIQVDIAALIDVLTKFSIVVLAALILHFFVWLPLLLWFVGKINPITYYSKIARAQLMAFSTASSSATLPVSLSCAQEAGISKRVTSFVLPLGATVNMDGTALYECVVVIFIAQIYAAFTGVDFTFMQQFTVVVLALLTSIGVAGIPAASLVAIALILQFVGLPVEWLALVLVVDRILDMCRTSTNVTSDLTIAALIARTEKEELESLRAA